MRCPTAATTPPKMNQEVMVVLSSSGKPMTVIRARGAAPPPTVGASPYDDRRRPRPGGACTAPVVSHPAAAAVGLPPDAVVQPSRKFASTGVGLQTAPGGNVRLEKKRNGTDLLSARVTMKSKDFEDKIELRRLRVENHLLQQRIDRLEKTMNYVNNDTSHNGPMNGSVNLEDGQQQTESNSNNQSSVQKPITRCQQCCRHDSTEADPEMQRLQDELVACKLREAEANLSMKDFEQRLNQLERHWQHFLCESRSDNEGKSPAQPDLRETVMGLRLRETHLVAGMNDLKARLMELETQNHIYERQIKRQREENASLLDNLSAAETRENELRSVIIQLERKVSNLESTCQEGAAMSRLRDAECSQSLEEMRRRVAELEIENEELLTASRLHERDDDSKYQNGFAAHNPDGIFDDEAKLYDGFSDEEDNDIISSDRLIRRIADTDMFNLPAAFSSLRLSTDNIIMTSSFLDPETAGLTGESRKCQTDEDSGPSEISPPDKVLNSGKVLTDDGLSVAGETDNELPKDGAPGDGLTDCAEVKPEVLS